MASDHYSSQETESSTPGPKARELAREMPIDASLVQYSDIGGPLNTTRKIRPEDGRLALFGRAALEQAGFRSNDLTRALNATRRGLRARKITRIHVGDGDIREFVDDDIRSQLTAADQIYRLSGAVVKEKDTGGEPTALIVEVITVGKDGEKTITRIGVGENG